MTPDDEERIAARTRYILQHAINQLSDAEFVQRRALCEANNTHGIRMYTDENDSICEFRWGGQTLALVTEDVLLDDSPTILYGRIDSPPDDLSGLE